MSLPDFQSFTEMPFPDGGEIVYALFARTTGTKHEIPFYVGQTARSHGRFGDYQSAKFSASTDFKVGGVVRALREFGYEVVIKYCSSSSRRDDEQELIARCRSVNDQLLNDLGAYNYRTSTPEEETPRLEEYARALVERLKALATKNGDA